MALNASECSVWVIARRSMLASIFRWLATIGCSAVSRSDKVAFASCALLSSSRKRRARSSAEVRRSSSFQLAVTLGCLRLAVQVLDLFLDLLEEVLQPVEVLFRMLDAVRGFPASFLVLRNAGRFFEKYTDLLRLRLDRSSKSCPVR